MRKFYILSAFLFYTCLSVHGQAYLIPEPGHKVAYHFSDTFSVRTFDVNEQFFYFDDGDTIYQLDPEVGGTSRKFGLPAEYDVLSYPSFLSISPDGASLWLGYTDAANADARIYCLDPETGVWDWKAAFPSNWDLEFWNDSLLVSGLNSADYNAPNAIFVLDTSGRNQHRRIIETGGNSAGLALDSHGNLYYGSSFLSGSNALYRWDSASVAAVVETPGATPLQVADAEKLADLPMTVYDCEVDAGDHVVFSMNTWGGTQILARWNGYPGDGANYDTLALSDAWLGMVKSRGDYTIQVPGNSLFTVSYNEPLADLHTCDYPPIQIAALPVLSGKEGSSLEPLDLSLFFKDLDDPGAMDFGIELLSEPGVANFQVEGTLLSGTFGSAGQANLVLEATSAGRSVNGRTVVGTWPLPEGDFRVSDFEESNLEEESYWNGSDGSGSFISGLARFHNDFNPDYYSWSGWSYSNISDTITPGYMNQYSAITGGGFDGNVRAGNYGTSSLYGPSVIDFTLDKPHALEGFFVTNSTYAALSMEEGDWVAKKFGGIDGTDPDYFILQVWGRKDGESTDTIEYYLADFREDESDKDYIIETWQWVDLSSLGKVDSLMFGLESSDVGDWGMNTPAYFCLDDLYVIPDAAPFVANPLQDIFMEADEFERIIDLSAVFSDPDDPDEFIVKEILSNDQDEYIVTRIEGNELRIENHVPQITKSTKTAELVIAGMSNALSVNDTLLVSVDLLGAVSSGTSLRFSVYPNPSEGRYTIKGGNGELLELRIYNMTGVLVYEDLRFESGQQLNISNQPSGPYLIRIQGESGAAGKLIQKL